MELTSIWHAHCRDVGICKNKFISSRRFMNDLQTTSTRTTNLLKVKCPTNYNGKCGLSFTHPTLYILSITSIWPRSLPFICGAHKIGLVRDSNPGPLAPEARIIPLDQRASSPLCFRNGCGRHMLEDSSSNGRLSLRCANPDFAIKYTNFQLNRNPYNFDECSTSDLCHTEALPTTYLYV